MNSKFVQSRSNDLSLRKFNLNFVFYVANCCQDTLYLTCKACCAGRRPEDALPDISRRHLYLIKKIPEQCHRIWFFASHQNNSQPTVMNTCRSKDIDIFALVLDISALDGETHHTIMFQ
jgi:hypothetical protein